MVLPLDSQYENFDDAIGRTSPPPGGISVDRPPAKVNVRNSDGEIIRGDFRARIRVPANYITKSTVGSENEELKNGIIFPYTPQITFDHKAEYQAISTVHTNYTQFFYKNSSVGSINITARFTVQNYKEAKAYLGAKHLLSALTKMPFGNDLGAGSPPPICRLDAYGTYMIKNVPVVITNFRIEFPSDVDYFDASGYTAPNSVSDFGLSADLGLNPADLGANISSTEDDINFVPVASNFIIACQPLYSRNEMIDFNVKNFLENYNNNSKYL